MSQQAQKYVSVGSTGIPSAYHYNPECVGLHGETPVVADNLPESVPGCRFCTERPDATQLRKQLHGDSQ